MFYAFMLVSPKSKTYNGYILSESFLKLQKLSRKLSLIDTNDCNGVYKEETTSDTLREIAYKKIKAITDMLGLNYYHQSDPRGVALYISDKPINSYSYNTQALAIY